MRGGLYIKAEDSMGDEGEGAPPFYGVRHLYARQRTDREFSENFTKL